SDRHGCYYVIGMNVIERSPCVGICSGYAYPEGPTQKEAAIYHKVGGLKPNQIGKIALLIEKITELLIS
ncbi:hypothetical protein ACV1DR_22845, partial [Aeromonas jandaei]